MSSSLPTVKFEAFWDEQATLTTGFGNISLKLETIAGLVVSVGLGYLVWNIVRFPVYLPMVRFDFGVIGPLVCSLPFFLSYRLATLQRSFFEICEDLLGVLVLPRVVPEPDAELVPLVID
ncbi:hypothetical protein [Gloeobacter morelensis]|uniref:Uncharacterized protein n=1 Tax=Gloeobacter morelensis MG652769 TaxID=2781736 RepID=A0ABY3PG37_9CYAN|nr:hypothetical protein [Gloeobacter morelensis]UFP92612.1 hypothetical protein ISF26_12225 [Gloeobacter morelensis MG652769]